MWHIYIIRCGNGQLYTGMTDNIPRRFQEHLTGQGGRFTKIFGTDKLIYQEDYLTRKAAMRRERQIKGWTRRKKMALIEGDMELLRRL